MGIAIVGWLPQLDSRTLDDKIARMIDNSNKCLLNQIVRASTSKTMKFCTCWGPDSCIAHHCIHRQCESSLHPHWQSPCHEETFLDIDWEAHRRGANRHHKRRTTLNKHLGNILPVGKVASRCDPVKCRSDCPPVALETGRALRPGLMCAGAQQEAPGGNSSCPVCVRS